jgi:hypothetical protein
MGKGGATAPFLLKGLVAAGQNEREKATSRAAAAAAAAAGGASASADDADLSAVSRDDAAKALRQQFAALCEAGLAAFFNATTTAATTTAAATTATKTAASSGAGTAKAAFTVAGLLAHVKQSNAGLGNIIEAVGGTDGAAAASPPALVFLAQVCSCTCISSLFFRN